MRAPVMWCVSAPQRTDPQFRFECIVSRVTVLVALGEYDVASVLADYATHHLDGQDGYDLGGEA